MQLLLLSADDVRAALPMPAAVALAKAAFAAQADGAVTAPARIALPVGAGVELIMPAHLPGTGLATKIVCVFPGNAARGRPVVQGVVLVLEEETGEPAALLDGTFLTAWRTAAAAGAAAQLLALPGARVGALLGAGGQGPAQLEALDALGGLERIRVWSRDASHAATLAERMQARLNARLEPVAAVDQALAGARVVVCATPARAPLFDARRLEPGAHLTSVGSFTPAMIEVDPALAATARVFVDDRAAALEEAGELLRARELGLTRPEDWTALGDVVAGRDPGRRTPEERTWFKSVGLAVQDVCAAAAVLAAARERGLGRSVEL